MRYTHPIDTEPLIESKTTHTDLVKNRLEHAKYTVQLDATL